MSGFRLQAKNFFLTYPQCNEPKEIALEAILQHFEDDINYCVVAHENHQDGTDHLHVVLSLKTKLRVSSPTWFDFVTGKHGNYQTQRNPVKNLKYVTKDGDYVSYGIDVQEWLNAHNNKQSTKGTLVATRILEGATFDDILEQEPGYVLSNKRKVEDLIEYTQQKRIKLDLASEFDEPFRFYRWQQTVIDKLDSQDNRKILWVWESVGDRGKTTIGRYLVMKKGAVRFENGKSEHIAYAYNSEPIVVMDFTKSYEGFVNYSIFESFKNGSIFSPKYESKSKYFRPPKVVCFANFEPDLTKMGANRFEVYQVPDRVNCQIRDI